MREVPKRLRFFSLVIIFSALVLGTKLYFVQIVNGDSFKQKAERQYIVGANYFNRGSVFFLNKYGDKVPAATLKSGFILAVNPEILSKNPDLESVYERINSIVPTDKEAFLTKSKKPNDPYEEIAIRLSQESAEKIRELGINGVSLFSQKWRVYPGGSMAAHGIGFMGYKDNELAGRYGLERYYENVLSRSGDDAFVNFFAEIFSNIQRSVSSDKNLEGDIVISIEPSVESFLEEELKKITNQYSSQFTGGIVIDPKTGEIYAMALDPAFDLNNSSKEKDVSVFRNKFVEDRYEMGSIVKALTIAAGLDSGAINENTTYNDPGCETLNKKTFCNYDGKSHGSGLKMQVVLNKSLNTGAAFIVSRMGRAKFADYMRSYGLGEITGIDLPNEGNSLISNLSSNRDLEYAQASFGQGIAMTPIQTVRALSVLANGGTLVTPHLVKEIYYKIGGKRTINYPQGDQVLKPETSERISRMLTEVVDTALKNGSVHLPNYSVAAKTGTAQIANPAGGYYEDRYLHSFFGYFPSYDPRFLVFLYTYNPQGVRYASETLTDGFIDLTKFLINYYNIPPDREAPPPPTVNKI